ncbi:MAG TPA: secondary thiamine-phosphate synthase enzyme YjbQ [Ignavibacteriaceae bacterium]|nr:secondary thiamine-phosphate synthase enzyme YjbQ [Ignavibacteriaceae bacterium]
MIWIQKEIKLEAKRRGFHIITDEITNQLTEIRNIKTGILYIFLKHTSASLTINENVSPDVRSDMEKHFSRMIPEGMTYYNHNSEGPDDMPAHIKSSILGNSLTVPITNGELNLGTWQGIYLGEHRNNGGKRKLVLTVYGE